MITPIEQAQAAVEALQEEIHQLEQHQHQLDRDRAAALQAGNIPEVDRIGNTIFQTNIVWRTNQGRLADARQRVAYEQKRLNQAANRVVEATRVASRVAAEIGRLQEQLQKLIIEQEAAQQAVAHTQQAVAALQPPDLPPDLPQPIVVAEPARAPEFEPPVSALHSRGEPSRYFAVDGTEVAADGRPLTT